MTNHFALGCFFCAVIVFFFLIKGRHDKGSLTIVVIGCIAILAVAANWDAIAHLDLLGASQSHTASTIVTPAPTTAPSTTAVPLTPTAVHVASTSPSVPSSQSGDGAAFGGFVGIALLFAIGFFFFCLIGAKRRAQSRQQTVEADNRDPVEV